MIDRFKTEMFPEVISSTFNVTARHELSMRPCITVHPLDKICRYITCTKKDNSTSEKHKLFKCNFSQRLEYSLLPDKRKNQLTIYIPALDLSYRGRYFTLGPQFEPSLERGCGMELSLTLAVYIVNSF